MSVSARFWSLVAATVLVTPAGGALFPQSAQAKGPPSLRPAPSQRKQVDDAPVLLQVEGTLAAGDETLTDDSRFDRYTFEGRAGQWVQIRLESDVFDTYLILLDGDGQKLAENDDAVGELNSVLVFELPADGTYQVFANGYDRSAQGPYRLTIWETTAAAIQQTAARQDRKAAADRLLQEGIRQYQRSQFREALATWEAALAIYQELADRLGEATVLGNLGLTHQDLSDYRQAIAHHEQALALFRDLAEPSGEANALNNLGNAYLLLSDYRQAIDYYEQGLALYQTLGNQMGEARALSNLGLAYQNLNDYRRAIAYFEEALPLAQAIEDPQGEANALNNLGLAYWNLSDARRAIAYYEQAIPLYRAIGDRQGEANSLSNLGLAYSFLSNYRLAIAYFEEALPLARAIGDRQIEANALNNLGLAAWAMSDYRQAIDYYEQSLAIAQAIEDRQGEANVRMNIGLAYGYLSDYSQAIADLEAALPLFRAVEDRQGEARTLNNLGLAYWSLSDYEQAIAYLEQALPVFQTIEDRQGEANVRMNLGLTYGYLGEYDPAIAYLEQALPLFQAIEDRQGEANALLNLGLADWVLGNYSAAIAAYEQALPLYRTMGNRQGEANALMNLGLAYKSLGDYRQAIAYYDQALPLFQAIEDRAGQGLLLSNIGRLLALQEQPELAILFYKQAVNVREDIRGDLSELPRELQQSYTESVAADYRALADLLLQQNRVPEAQRVLDLLKVQELDDYLQSVQRTGRTETGVDFWQVETDLLALYRQVVDQATELRQLEARSPGDRTAAEQQRLETLRAIRDEAAGWFYKFLDDPEVIATVDQIRSGTRGRNLEPDSLVDLANNLRQLPQKTAALYPLILPDRLELVLVMPEGPPLRYPVAVSATELNQAIVAFGQALKSPHSDIEPLAQQLYTWLMAPLAEQLQQTGIESLIYAPDGALRYIPLAALHDGDRYVIERFSLSYITAASLSDINLQPQPQERRLLAAACAECSFTINVGEEQFIFSDLPFTEVEVTTLAEQVSGVDVLLNQAFNPDAMAELPRYDIIHLATHAAFVTGSPDESFILFGNGETINLRRINRDWNLDQAELVVLSACETAVGSSELGSGVEILGLGYQIEQAGAQATLASLWKVSDGGTQALMTAFYAALQQGMTKAQALQAAQQALIDRHTSAADSGDRAGGLGVLRSGVTPPSDDGYRHPYYWAPFILIGNSL